jgi:hypothetical protein
MLPVGKNISGLSQKVSLNLTQGADICIRSSLDRLRIRIPHKSLAVSFILVEILFLDQQS